MSLPRELVGRQGNCSECKKVVEIIEDTSTNTTSAAEIQSKKTNTTVIDTAGSNIIAEDDLKHRLTELQHAREQYALLHGIVLQDQAKLDEAVGLKSDFYIPLGKAAYLAHTKGEISEINALYPLLGAYSQIESFQTELSTLTARPVEGIWIKIKTKVAQISLSQKIKRLHKSTPLLETAIGKSLFDNETFASVMSPTTETVLSEISAWQENIATLTSAVDESTANLITFSDESAETISLPRIESIATIDHAISISQQSLAELQAPTDAMVQSSLHPIADSSNPTPVVSPNPTPVVSPNPTPVISPNPTPVISPNPTPVISPYSKPVNSSSIQGLTPMGTSLNVFRFLFNLWPFFFVYGLPTNFRLGVGNGLSPEQAVEAVTTAFLNAGFKKRSFGASLVSGNTVKCPGAITAMRDVRIKADRAGIVVIGHTRDVSRVLGPLGLSR